MIAETGLGEFAAVSELLHQARRLRALGRPATADARLRQLEVLWPSIEPHLRTALLRLLRKADPSAVAGELHRLHKHDAAPRPPEDAA